MQFRFKIDHGCCSFKWAKNNSQIATAALGAQIVYYQTSGFLNLSLTTKPFFLFVRLTIFMFVFIPHIATRRPLCDVFVTTLAMEHELFYVMFLY